MRENEKPEAARRRFDNGLLVSQWATPGSEARKPKDRPAGAPDWWVDDAEASSTFLEAMGVSLDGDR